MLFVGLFGGACYVNVYYQALNDNSLNKEDKELCVNIIALHVTIGIMCSSGAILLLDQTLWKDQ